jgi:hypothetical protein
MTVPSSSANHALAVLKRILRILRPDHAMWPILDWIGGLRYSLEPAFDSNPP